METKLRSLIKTVVYETICAITTALFVYYWTGNIVESLVSGVAVEIVDFITYYLHERLWAKIGWGYKK